jgi:hypothetical protein
MQNSPQRKPVFHDYYMHLNNNIIQLVLKIEENF